MKGTGHRPPATVHAVEAKALDLARSRGIGQDMSIGG
jgi:hypothetical protein